MKHRIEVFTAGCPLCESALEMVEEAKCPECDLSVYDLSRAKAEDIDRARRYGVKAAPSIVVDGELEFCGVPDMGELRESLA